VTFEAARPASAADLDRLTELAGVAADELSTQRGGPLWAVREARPSPRLADLHELLGSAHAHVLAGTFADVVVGYATVSVEELRDGSRLGVLHEIYVEPGAREVGVGEALMDEVVAWCRGQRCRGVDSLVLPGNREAKNFFERFGLTARAIVVHRALDGDDGAET
jgi:ribosomal protein S18 acetylase RimI-like enzyme